LDAGFAPPELRRQAGIATPQWVAMVAAAMLILAFAANLVAMQYAIGAGQAAVDRAARVGSAVGGSPGRCVDVIELTLRGEGGLLRGRLGEAVSGNCRIDGETMVATAAGPLAWWFGALPPAHIHVESRSVVEQPP